jgi:hypothetical protein
MASVTHDVVHERAAEKVRAAQPYSNPYLAGIGRASCSSPPSCWSAAASAPPVRSTPHRVAGLAAPAYARSNEFPAAT